MGSQSARLSEVPPVALRGESSPLTPATVALNIASHRDELCRPCSDKSEAFWRYLAAVGIGAWICLSIGGFYAIGLLVWQAFTTF